VIGALWHLEVSKGLVVLVGLVVVVVVEVAGQQGSVVSSMAGGSAE
jgi:hypothetical protein